MGMQPFDWIDAQSVLAIISLGHDAVREFMLCRDYADVSAWNLKWYGKERITVFEACDNAIAKMDERRREG